MKKRSTSKTSKINDLESTDNAQPEVKKFTFRNGDIYEGEYKMNYDQFVLVKQGDISQDIAFEMFLIEFFIHTIGIGTYTTDNFDVYYGEWNDDSFADSDIDIKYNNDAQYRGRIDSNGTMNGQGTYIFPDGSLVEAVWLNNIPFENIIYKEPLGFAWIVEDKSKDSITFSPGNHFWKNMKSDQSTIHSTECSNQIEEN
ncbi:unnamed protein product [Xylocopa violacea]|uniref:MORN repeat-containing protein 5 n=1 Tax=Xylocopa violacea TaxID=135666 RepID=A0ABP1NKW8_XYLVO